MMMIRAVLVALFFQAIVADVAVDAGSPKKSNAVNKVMKMLNDLAAKVEDEGVKEEKTYFKFDRFCKEASEERQQAINDGKVLKQELEALIDTKNARIGVLALDIETLNSEIDTLRQEIADATKQRADERATFEKDDAEIMAAIKALDRAVEGIQNSQKGPGPMSLLQKSDDFRSAVLLADSMGFASGAASALLDSEGAAPTQDYNFHSGGIIATLEQLQEEFRTARTTASQEEITSRGAHTMTMQAKEQLIDKKTRQLGQATSEKDAATQAEGNAQKKLSTTEKTLAEDEKYFADLTVMCQEKQTTFEERKSVRENELNALKSAIDIMSEGMTPLKEKSLLTVRRHAVSVNLVHAAALSIPVIRAAEAAAEALEPARAKKAEKKVEKKSFLQIRSSAQVTKEVKDKIIAFIRSKSVELHSPALLSLARRAGRNDNLQAVRDMLQGMIDRLKEQDAQATDHKAFCDQSMAENAEKRDEAAKQVADYNAKMASEQTERDTLKEEIAMLQNQVAELTKSQEDATAIRNEESQENKDAVDEAKDGKDATERAIEVLKAFYEANAPVSLARQPPTGPMADAPDAGFKNGQTNHGSQAEATGVLGMLDVILADMDRTIADTEAAEAKSATEHDQFMTETNADKDQKNSDISQKEAAVGSLETDIAGSESSLNTHLLALTNAMNEAADLDAACNVKANYQERIEKRDKEIKEIKKAIDFFNDPTKTLALR